MNLASHPDNVVTDFFKKSNMVYKQSNLYQLLALQAACYIPFGHARTKSGYVFPALSSDKV